MLHLNHTLGNYAQALPYHQVELSLSEDGGDTLGAAIAHRKIGECYCELEDYEEAVIHQGRHLHISRELGTVAHLHTHVPPHKHACIHTRVHICVHTRAYTQEYMHTYTHTHR